MLRNFAIALLCALSLTAHAADTPVSSAENLFIRDALAAKGLSKGLDKNPELLKLVEEFRKDQLARLALEASVGEGMPDFEARAEEIYQARKDKQYRLPLRLRVRVLEMDASGDKEETVRNKLEALRSQIDSGQLDFRIAVLQHSEAADRKLSEGDSQWFHQGQKPDVFFDAAEKLTEEHPLSSIIVHRGTAWLLYFMDKKEPETRSLDEVKPEIITELQQEHRQAQEKALLESLREQYRQTAGAKLAEQAKPAGM
ncbi:MAG: peptidylprolyl isomerase [Gammaproteobacteria bacterium]|nr:peptidylprolyl isomerase [Gammaproteobacteria bacterium]MBU1722387.1 peptidylprolyl isomerase [Gammaproteobacteria bacterium]MBU2004676.1 peptidylprolyl isomerase [Gammaproteobacteria bacterium]